MNTWERRTYLDSYTCLFLVSYVVNALCSEFNEEKQNKAIFAVCIMLDPTFQESNIKNWIWQDVKQWNKAATVRWNRGVSDQGVNKTAGDGGTRSHWWQIQMPLKHKTQQSSQVSFINLTFIMQYLFNSTVFVYCTEWGRH